MSLDGDNTGKKRRRASLCLVFREPGTHAQPHSLSRIEHLQGRGTMAGKTWRKKGLKECCASLWGCLRGSSILCALQQQGRSPEQIVVSQRCFSVTRYNPVPSGTTLPAYITFLLSPDLRQFVPCPISGDISSHQFWKHELSPRATTSWTAASVSRGRQPPASLSAWIPVLCWLREGGELA